MSNFLDTIKITDEDKKKTMSSIVLIMLYSQGIMSLEEILQTEEMNGKVIDGERTHRKIQDKLNENEILATYSLAKEIKISILGSSDRNRKLLDYLELGTVSLNSDKLLRFVNEAVRDIETLKRHNPNVEWNLQINKIFSRLEGKDPTKGEVLGCESEEPVDRNSNKIGDKIIKFPKEYSGEERA